MADQSVSWTWVRHAPALLHGRFCGRSNPALEDGANFGGISRQLPKDSATFVSPLLRATQTLDGLRAAGFAPEAVIASPLIVEQDFGDMEGQPYASVWLPDGAQNLAAWCPPHGESFNDLAVRVRRFITEAPVQAREICVITHAGVIRAALAVALNLEPGRALSLAVNPLSITALTQTAGHWQVGYMNRIAP